MAGEQIYLGKILGQLKQDTKDYSATLQTVIKELQNVRLAISQNVVTFNVKPSENLKFTGANPRKVGNTTKAEIKVDLIKFKVFCTGVIRLKIIAYSDTSLAPAGLLHFSTPDIDITGNQYRLTTTPGTKYTVDIPVSAGDIVSIYLLGSGEDRSVIIPENSIWVYYDLLDIVNGTGISLF